MQITDGRARSLSTSELINQNHHSSCRENRYPFSSAVHVKSVKDSMQREEIIMFQNENLPECILPSPRVSAYVELLRQSSAKGHGML